MFWSVFGLKEWGQINFLNHVIFPAKIQISKPIDVSVFMFDLRMISMSSKCEYDWYWKISTEYEVCDSFASLTRQQTSYSGSACWYFRYQSIHIQITYTYFSITEIYMNIANIRINVQCKEHLMLWKKKRKTKKQKRTDSRI